jgi:hypothetical protein
MLLQQTVRLLYIGDLLKKSKRGIIGCPFMNTLGGPVETILGDLDLCTQLCGRVFPQCRQKDGMIKNCPCCFKTSHMGPTRGLFTHKDMRRTFWKAIYKYASLTSAESKQIEKLIDKEIKYGLSKEISNGNRRNT